ncbi:sulfotransferase [Synechococcus sp. PROS-U-1]|uniref:sulfotransferase family protein n=1 Tax=Synechococcus sp. PROS-U-1 TaxID=1400866 RepID=UPI0016484877|nr:sulfotransferase [Synechococcus sp. PROS-U-1]QNJ04215.1 sulfotransferase domain protein [Synechococcus sp. PROS-U-1]
MAEQFGQSVGRQNVDALISCQEDFESCLLLEDFNGALVSLRRLCLREDLGVDCFRNLGLLYQFCGRLDCSLRSLLCALHIDGSHASSHYTLSKQIRYQEYPFLAERLKGIDAESYVSYEDRIKICFAKSNLFHQYGDYEASACWLERGNGLRLLEAGSDLRQTQAIGDFRAGLVSQCPVDGHEPGLDEGRGLIFVVGLPRCGSTLLDAILCMSEKVGDLGECSEFEKAVAVRIHLGWGENSLKLLGKDYLEAVRKRRQDKYLVDKSLFNFINIDLIAQCFPRAKIIHCRRNPFAHALSLYRANIFPGSTFSSSLEDIAEMIIYERRLVSVFSEKFPGRIFPLKYEEMVSDPSSVLRDLVEWLELPWTDDFLGHHRSGLVTQTASRVQVRRPIGSQSLELWRNYSRMLRPMKQALWQSMDVLDLF